ncbi:MAG: hypothetical protein AAF826_07010 [Pseudomonadota bacterium]
MRSVLLAAGLLAAAPIYAAEWERSEADGVITAAITLSELDYVETLCDAGIDIPITSISFMVQGNPPRPGTDVEFRFGPQNRIIASIDDEGVIPSQTEDSGAVFDELIAEMQARSEVLIRLQNGVRQTFPLAGSEAALEGCKADAHKFAVLDGS